MTFSITVLMLALSGDFVYFSTVNRHMSEELIAAFADREFIIKYSLQYYWWVLCLFFLSLRLQFLQFLNLLTKNLIKGCKFIKRCHCFYMCDSSYRSMYEVRI